MALVNFGLDPFWELPADEDIFLGDILGGLGDVNRPRRRRRELGPEEKGTNKPLHRHSSMVLDLCETKDFYRVIVDVPGLKKEDINISIKDNLLHISGERKHAQDTEVMTFHRIERPYGKFDRVLKLPQNADDSRCTAKYEDGVLIVDFAKKPEQGAELGGKKISIQ
eukprot:GILJ01025826.1.p1 GENE.GILJ01025826.1~~GILJ01025826.1.p1  ORF type:complete len:167 (+),score=24.41 GILJ01025826.1:71-571(+)